jgi:hypothetical protein
MAVDASQHRSIIFIALAALAAIWIFRLSFTYNVVIDRTKAIVDDVSGPYFPSSSSKPHQKARIHDRVAVITDTQYTTRLIPLIMHFHAVLGPEWPIIFYTSPEIEDLILPAAPSPDSGSGVWRRALENGDIEVRHIPTEYDLSDRTHVNLYLSRPWLWEQLAPAKHVLVFQADAMLCANANRTIDSFLQYDMAGAYLNKREYNGGLSLRNRQKLLEILAESRWEDEVDHQQWDPFLGEDVWFSRKLQKLEGTKLPDEKETHAFAIEFEWQTRKEKHPFGYHKIHKAVHNQTVLDEIVEWCPEISLAMAGSLN